jgi:hypothetical protein
LHLSAGGRWQLPGSHKGDLIDRQFVLVPHSVADCIGYDTSFVGYHHNGINASDFDKQHDGAVV